jgi:steroid delta-isomerase-like uncharacterized protein
MGPTASVPADDGQSTVDPEAVARAYVAMWNDRDVTAIPDLVTETFVMYDPAAPAAGVPGPKGEAHGRDGLQQFVGFIDTAFPDFEVAILDLVCDDDLVMYEVELTMTHDGPLGGLPPTGRTVALRGVSVLHLEGGRVREHRFHTNMAEVPPQLGLAFPQVLRSLPSLLLGKVRMAIAR